MWVWISRWEDYWSRPAATGRLRPTTEWRYLHVFQRLCIGLWSYEPKTENIEKCFTSARTCVKNPSAREKALKRISQNLDLVHN